MDLTHCKHNVPMEVECMACESDEANSAGAGEATRCACGETAAPFPYTHNRGNCLIDGVWVPAETFRLTGLALVEQLVKAQKRAAGLDDDLVKAREAFANVEREFNRTRRQADEWRDAARSLARVIGRYAETGRIE